MAAAMGKQAAPERMGAAGFNRSRAGRPEETDWTVWMFDNEIDWVTCLESCRFRREAQPGGASLQMRLNTRPSTSNELLKLVTQASVQVRRVSLGVMVSSA